MFVDLFLNHIRVNDAALTIFFIPAGSGQNGAGGSGRKLPEVPRASPRRASTAPTIILERQSPSPNRQSARASQQSRDYGWISLGVCYLESEETLHVTVVGAEGLQTVAPPGGDLQNSQPLKPESFVNVTLSFFR